jgi:hypothetical protein
LGVALTVKNIENLSNERIKTTIPLRVLSFDLEHFETGGGFSEDARTLFVSRTGASVVLRNPVTTGDSLRIVNLIDHSEADFRVVGPLGNTEDGAGLWAVECMERGNDFWGVKCPPASAEIAEENVCIQCRACGSRVDHPLTFMEREVLRSAGIIILNCEPCGKLTYWVDAGLNRPTDNLPTAAVAPPPRVHELEKAEQKKAEKRAVKRSSLKFAILVRSQTGEQEISKTADMSKFGVSVNLFMKLDVGNTVKMICPYDPRSGGIEQTAEVRWRSPYYNDDFPRTYGLRFIR